MRIPALLRACAIALTLPALAASQPHPIPARVALHAHNCFPEDGRWADRLDRALGTGAMPIAIEQDLLWTVDAKSGAGRSVLSHGDPVTGADYEGWWGLAPLWNKAALNTDGRRNVTAALTATLRSSVAT